MKVFMIKQFGRTAYYIINDEGDISFRTIRLLKLGVISEVQLTKKELSIWLSVE